MCTVLGRIAPWRHLVAGASVAGCTALAGLGLIGGGIHPERFDAKQVTVRVTPAGGLAVREVVDQDFGSFDRHGYERFIPHDFGVPIDIRASSPDAPDDVDVLDLGDETRIRIGDPDTTIDGQHRYVLTYTYPEPRLDSGELALDIIGPWEELETGRFEVIVDGLRLQDTRCNVGSFGDVGGCALELDPDSGRYRAVIEPLEAHRGITVGGTIGDTFATDEPPLPPLPDRRDDRRLLMAGIIAPLGLVGWFGTYRMARRIGSNEVFSGGAADAAYGELAAPLVDLVPARRSTSIEAKTRRVADDELDDLATIEFVPPPGIEPWQGAVLLDEHIDAATVGAWFSGVIAHDGLAITRDGDDVVLRPGPRRDALDPHSAGHVDRLLDRRDQLQLGQYDAAFTEAWADVRRDMVAQVAAAGWWTRMPPGVKAGLGSVPGAGIVLAIIAFAIFGAGSAVSAIVGVFGSVPLGIAFGLLVPIITAYFVYRVLLPSRSATGSALALRAESFRRFLAASEGRHVDWAWEHGLLREYSAWAVALGTAEAWSSALAASNVPQVERTAMSAPLLVHTMGPTITASHTRPAPSGGSGGGFSGGGFSGGSVGGGGGGGSSGSW